MIFTSGRLQNRSKDFGRNPVWILEAISISDFNRSVKNGRDEKFDRSVDTMRAVAGKGPYYAIEESGCCLVTVNGLRTDADSRVLDHNGKAIEGLYALGNTSGSMFNGTYPHHMSAVSHGRCLTFGYLVGRRLAGLED